LEKVLSSESQSKFLIFRLGVEIYGTPLLNVREVIEYKDPKPVPNSDKSFEGVINLRGEVIGILDLRKIFGVEAPPPAALLVFECEMGVLAGAVDKVVSVTEIKDANIDRKQSTGKRNDVEYMIGIGKTDLGLVTLIDLMQIPKMLR
jgi:purine-binding chemotaxis protein CheW